MADLIKLSRTEGPVGHDAIYIERDIRDDPSGPQGRAEKALVEYCERHALHCEDLAEILWRPDSDTAAGHRTAILSLVREKIRR